MGTDPGGHNWHALLDKAPAALNFPALHSRHADALVDPVLELNVPGLQLVHWAEPSESAYVPGGHVLLQPKEIKRQK